MDEFNRKYLLKSNYQTALYSRLLAKGIDLFAVSLLIILLYPLGVILSVIYLCVCDSIQNGQSLGKRIIGLAVISLEDGRPCSVKQSLIRNLPFILPMFLLIIPIVGWVMFVLLILPIVILEIYLLSKLDSGHRLGDVMADTSVMAPNGPDRIAVKKVKASWFDKPENAVSRSHSD